MRNILCVNAFSEVFFFCWCGFRKPPVVVAVDSEAVPEVDSEVELAVDSAVVLEAVSAVEPEAVSEEVGY